MKSQRVSIGVISDTHGLLRPEVARIFQNVSLILHAGDIGSLEVLDGLKSIAPVIAVRGNNDEGAWAEQIPDFQLVRVEAVCIYVLHNVKEMHAHALGETFHVVVSGHSHRPSIEQREGVLFLNPGSAGPRRFKLPVCVARMIVQGQHASAELIDLSGIHSKHKGTKAQRSGQTVDFSVAFLAPLCLCVSQ